jgi:putative phosphoesterase
VKLLILSDIHGNLDALHAIRESYDELWVLGDIVNYGPEPREALEAVRVAASIVVQGNHDHAVGHCDDSRWSARFREVAEATRRFTSSQLSAAQKAYLRSLPVKVQVEREGLRFYLTHATPSDHHYGRIAADSDDWVAELERLDADVLLVGHSHVPFIRRIGGKVASIRAAWDSRDPATPARVMRFGMTANLFFVMRTTQLKRQSRR